MTTCVFPGQGSQSPGMGKELFDIFPDLTVLADDELGYSIKELCLDDPFKQLGNTEYAQPALYVVNALAFLRYIDSSPKPNYLAGHSLGEYNALFAAEAFDFLTGLKLVKKRGEVMGEAMNGGMAAVIGLSAEAIKTILNENNFNQIDLANYNSPTQIVISGLTGDIEAVGQLLKKAGAKLVVPLQVSAAFHSRYMQSAAKAFETFIGSFVFNPLNIPVIANCTAKPYEADKIKETLAHQIHHPVYWMESINYLLALGEAEFCEIGNGQVLTKLIRQIKANVS